MKKLIIIIILVLIALAIWFYTSQIQEEVPPVPLSDSTEELEEVESIDVGDIDKEFEGIDQELNGL